MKHFYYYPTVEYGSEQLVNIMLRGKIRDAILQKTALYYEYKIKDGQRPDIVADKYYGNSRYAWAIFYANNMFHPVHDWPMDSTVFSKYLETKYGVSYPRGSLAAIKHYEVHNKQTKETLLVDKNTYMKYGSPSKIATQIDALTYRISDTLSGETYTIDSSVYATSYVDSSLISRAVSVYEHEVETNEAKRDIVILEKKYLTQLTNEFITLFK